MLLIRTVSHEVRLGIAYLEFRGPNSAVWMVLEFECGNWPKFRAKSIMCYFGIAYFRVAPLRIGQNCKNFKKEKNVKNSKTLIKSKN
jgi:hypothetical protein